MERDHWACANSSDKKNFNSHAHVERDDMIQAFIDGIKISTHTLTWSVTVMIIDYITGMWNFNSHAHVERDQNGGEDKPQEIISTHTLTWSVTGRIQAGVSSQQNFNSHAHVERDVFLVEHIRDKLRFQLTRSRGA